MGWDWARRFGLLAGGLMALGLGCSPSVYQCAQDTQCGSAGFCEASGFCSFVDAGCPSGRRYGTFAGDQLGESCVETLGSSTGGVDETTAIPDLESTDTGASSSSSGDPTTTGIVPVSEGSSSSSDSVSESSSTGPAESSSTGPPALVRVEDGLVILYTLDEAEGTTVHDTAPVDPPVDLTLTGTGFAWVSGGLRFDGDDGTIAGSTTSTTKLNTACADTNEITLESWVTTASVGTPGPPRIVTYSEHSGSRNFSLMVGSNVTGDAAPGFRGRLRTDVLVPNGTPSTVVELEAQTKGQLQHVVYVREASGDERMFVDAAVGVETTRVGDFSTWDTMGAMRLGLGNEFAEPRPLDGTLHLVAVYCRALQPDEVQQNFDAGL